MLSSLKQLLESNGVTYEPLRHSPAFTAQEVAAAEPVPGREHAKVTIVRAGDRLLFARDERIVFQAGAHDESVRMRYADFKRLARPRIED